MLCFAVYNVVKYLILLKKYETPYLTAFYTFTILLAIAKIAMLICSFRYEHTPF